MSSIVSGVFAKGGQIDIDYSITSQNISNNTSTISFALYIKRDGYGPSWSDHCDSGVNINGSRALTYTGSFSVGSSWLCLGSGSVTVPHNADGTKTCNFNAWFNSNVSITGLSVSQDVVLPTIPRAGQVSISSPNFNIGDTPRIYTNTKSSGFAYKVYAVNYEGYSDVQIADSGGPICHSYMDFATSNYSWLLSQIPNSEHGNGQIRLDTYTDDSCSTFIGSTYCYFTAHVVNSNPSFSGFTWAVTDSISQSLTGNNHAPIKNKSQVSITISGEAAYNYASIQSYSAKYGDKVVTSLNETVAIGTLPDSGDLIATVTDSRGFTASKTQSITVTDYDSPQLDTFNAERVNRVEANTLLTLSGHVSDIVNTHTTASYKVDGEASKTGPGTWQTLGLTWNGSQFSFSGSIGNLRVDETLTLTIKFTDSFGEYSFSVYIPTAQPVYSVRDTMFGINKIPTHPNSLDVHGDFWLDGIIHALFQTVNLTPAAYTGPNAAGVWWQPRITRIGNMCFFHGEITGPAVSAGTILMTVPEGFRPDKNVELNTMMEGGNGNITLVLETNGNLSTRYALQNSGWIGFSFHYESTQQ